jgi:protein-tyrosine phosphatase
MGGMRHDARYRVCFVCSGNICRSPMAEVVFRRLARDAGLGAMVESDSAGTGDWHLGERADRRTVAALAAAGYDGDPHRARQFDPRWFDRREAVIALDRGHLRTLRSWARSDQDLAKIALLRSFDPAVATSSDSLLLDVPDPYYDGERAFAQTLRLVEDACRGLLDVVRVALDADPSPAP